MQLKYGSQKLVRLKNRIRFTDKKYKCIRNYDGRGGGGGGQPIKVIMNRVYLKAAADDN